MKKNKAQNYSHFFFKSSLTRFSHSHSIYRWWADSSPVWLSPVPGAALMSLTELTLRCCPWSPNSWSPLGTLKQPRSPSSCLRDERLSWWWLVPRSSLWTPVTLAEPSYRITWRLCSDPSLWWCQIMVGSQPELFVVACWSMSYHAVLLHCFSKLGCRIQQQYVFLVWSNSVKVCFQCQ